MPWLLDTNIVIHACEGNSRVLKKLIDHDGAALLSALCFGELNRGLHRDPSQMATRQARLQLLTKRIPIVPFDAQAADHYGRIIAVCGWNRSREFDRMIGAHAIATASILVTNNIADFQDIPGLKLEDWT